MLKAWLESRSWKVTWLYVQKTGFNPRLVGWTGGRRQEDVSLLMFMLRFSRIDSLDFLDAAAAGFSCLSGLAALVLDLWSSSHHMIFCRCRCLSCS